MQNWASRIDIAPQKRAPDSPMHSDAGGFDTAEQYDPFYSPDNQKRLMRSIAHINAGEVTEHELIED